MKSKIPSKNFWEVGQSFIIISPSKEWPNILKYVIDVYKSSPFDVYEIGAEQNVTVVESRALEIEAHKRPSQSKIKLCVIYNADNLNAESANTLLKIIEEPPNSTRLLLFAETRNTLPTIKSRCSTWTQAQNIKNNANSVIPLDNSQNFATVSLRVAEIISANKSAELIDLWTNELIIQNRPELLTWLIQSRESLQESPLNTQARLEASYLAIINHIQPPS